MAFGEGREPVAEGMAAMTEAERSEVVDIMLGVLRRILQEGLAPLPDGYRGYVVDELFIQELPYLNGGPYVEDMERLFLETGLARYDDAAMGRA